MVNWGILGAGNIARVFANALRFSKTGRLEAVASRTSGKARALAGEFGAPLFYDCYEDLLANPSIDVVYVSTIHPDHLNSALLALNAGKHVLVEKPMALSARDASRMIQAADERGLFLMEGLMYRCHPQMAKARELIEAGALGQVFLVRSSMGYYSRFDPVSRVFNPEKGGGAILDIGAYPVSMTRWVAGAASGKPFLDPVEFKACGVAGPTGVDHYSSGSMRFANGVVAEIAVSVSCALPSAAVVYGTEGSLSFEEPWLPSTPCRFATGPLTSATVFPSAKLVLHKVGAEPEAIWVGADRDLFTYEADMAAACLTVGQCPAVSWADSMGNIAVLDAWREQLQGFGDWVAD